jgi:hypothetical protein
VNLGSEGVYRTHLSQEKILVVGSCEEGNELLDSTERGNFFTS